jgi:hypothetical protein
MNPNPIPPFSELLRSQALTPQQLNPKNTKRTQFAPFAAAQAQKRPKIPLFQPEKSSFLHLGARFAEVPMRIIPGCALSASIESVAPK